MSQFVKRLAYLRPDQNEGLEKLSNRTGAPIAELIRRAIDLYLRETEPTEPEPVEKRKK